MTTEEPSADNVTSPSQGSTAPSAGEAMTATAMGSGALTWTVTEAV